ncbi:MAG TPA: histidine-type phosphatase [Bryobacteraceae bacterium]|nr:histidine-type phosphatase [Bryobacteraceae bacterium]
MKAYFAPCAALAVLCAPFLAAQAPDDTVLKQVIIFGRHAVRTPVESNNALSQFAVEAYPTFTAAGTPGPAVITPYGQANEQLLGGYFRQWLTQENLLTGNDKSDAAFVYVRANNAPLIVDTAQSFAAGLLPAATLTINTTTTADPLFDPIDAGVAQLNGEMAVAAVNGRLGNNPQALATTYAAEFALARAVLFNYPPGTSPAPPTPAGKTDITTLPITATPGNSTMPVGLGGLSAFYLAIDPFLLEYTNGMANSEVGWGQLDAASICQIYRVYDALLDLEFRTPYLAKVQSSNVASHIVRTLVQAATGNAASGTVGTPSDKIVVLVASNTNITGLAGLLQLDWLVQGYQRDVAALGGALVFQLRQSQRTGEFIVRASYIAQTMDQLRNTTPLTLSGQPANIPGNVPVFIPGCSVGNATFDCSLGSFVRVAERAIDSRYADLVN